MTQTVLLGNLLTDLAMGPFGSNLKVDNFIDAGVPVVKGGNLYGYEVGGDFSFVSEEKARSLKRSLAYPDDIIITHRGTLGQVSIVPYGKHPYYLASQSQLRMTPDKSKINPRYLLYYLRSSVGQYELMQHAAQVGVPSIATPTKAVKSFKVLLPDLKTQQKIVDILGTIDEKIELNRQMNETLEQMGQALFRHYFIDNPEVEKWGERAIGELCEVKIGRTPPRKEHEWFARGDGEMWVSIKDMGRGTTFISDSSEYITKEAVAKFNIQAIEPNTLLLSFKLTIGRLCISTKRMYSNEAIAQLPLKSSEISIEYLYYFLRNFNYDQLSSTSSIATAVNSTTVKNIKIAIPAEAAMKDFTNQAYDILEVVKNNEVEIQTLTTLRDTLLPRLINGKVKVV